MADNTEQHAHKLIPCDFQKYDLHHLHKPT